MERLNKVACGFMFVLVVAFMCGSRPVSGLLNTYLYINNTIAPNTDFTYKCNSTAGDFDKYTLNYMHEWHTKFENFGTSTKFWCNMRWTDKNGRQVKGKSDLFIGNRDEEKCHFLCKYYAKVDGIYLHNSVKNKLELMYAWPKSKVAEICVAAWKAMGIYTETKRKALEEFIHLFKDETFPAGTSILCSL